MGRADRIVRVLLIDPDEAFQAEMKSVSNGVAELVFLDLAGASPVHVQEAQADIVVVGVDGPAGLSLVGDLRRRPSTPPVIAVCGAGFEGKTIEHVLLLAEARGAVKALPKPMSVGELQLVVCDVMRSNWGVKRPEDRDRDQEGHSSDAEGA